MVKRLAIILILLSPAANAAVSPLATSADYRFTHPLLTNAIHGVVMGDTGDYATMRYEDIAFISEALAEREMLTRQSVSASAVLDVFTNSVKSLTSAQITGRSFTLYPKRYLADVNQLSTSPRIVSLTNTFESVRWSLPTNIVPASTNYLYQTMTNATVDVWTNIVAAHVTNVLCRSTATNTVFSAADFCTTTGIVTLAETEPLMFKRDSETIVLPLYGAYSRRAVTNLYGLVRRMRVSVPSSRTHFAQDQNNILEIDSSTTGTGGYATTNVTSSPTPFYSYSINAVRSARDRQTRSGDAWTSDSGYPIDGLQIVRSSKAPQQWKVDIVSGLSNELAVNGLSRRINAAWSWALVTVSSRTEQYASHSVQDGSVVDVNTNRHQSGSVMVPLGKVFPRQGDTTNLVFEAQIPSAIFSQASDILDIPFVSDTTSPGLPSAVAGQWDLDDPVSPSTRTKYSSQSSSTIFSATLETYLVLLLNPTTKLDNWSEYE